jgi:hypothetical protein
VILGLDPDPSTPPGASISRCSSLSAGATPTIGYALDYMNIYAIGTLFVELTLGLNCFISAMGKTHHGDALGF